MKHKIFILLLTSFASCSLFQNKTTRAIEICQKAKAQFNIATDYIDPNTTILDYTNVLSLKEQSKKYEWHAKSTGKENIYIVEFTDTGGFGYRWKVDINSSAVLYEKQHGVETSYTELGQWLQEEDVSKVIIVNEAMAEIYLKNSSLKTPRFSKVATTEFGAVNLGPHYILFISSSGRFDDFISDCYKSYPQLSIVDIQYETRKHL